MDDVIIITDGSVIFRVGYHIWLVQTTYEEILMAGGGPDGREAGPNDILSVGAWWGIGRTRCSRYPV
jgi:hypothetical protein